MGTLPDYLMEGLDIVFVGINPSEYSARVGHYFANPRNRFWKAFNRSGLVKLELSPELDYTLPGDGIGLTDLVKRATGQASQLTSDDYRRGALALKEKLEHFRPLIVCFQGSTSYRQYVKYAEGVRDKAGLGLQGYTIGRSRVFVIPNPSAANARFSVDELAQWYGELLALRDELKVL